MKTKMRWKMVIDILMSVMLLLLMAYQVVGDYLHEICGTAMLVLFLMHHILNVRWYKSLLKGKYMPQRVIGTMLNGALLAVMFSLAYSGVVLSRHVFDFLPITSGMALARVMHLSASYWGFVLMSLHIGLHWGMVAGMFHKLAGEKRRPVLAWIVRFLAVAIAIYGAVCFWYADIFSYMFVKVEFVFFDYEKSAALVFAEHIAMMGTWIFAGYYVQKGIGRLAAAKRK
ncbi:MAG: DUF4405 domain-containing protein [Lachnospiraceae bacterium]|nr:DUF4405 domain-containing protein [Lachnospiraceae bacterium]